MSSSPLTTPLLRGTSSSTSYYINKVKTYFTFLKYSKEYKSIICSKCSTSLGTLSSIKIHLKKKHLDVLDSKKIEEILLTLEEEELELVPIEDIKEPLPYTTFFKDLEEVKGYSCLKCSYLTRHYKALRQHFNKEHLLKETLKEYYLEDISLESFSSNNKTLKYFITSKNSKPKESLPLIGPPSLVDTILNKYKAKEEALNQTISIKAKDLETRELSSFLNNSKFHLYFIEKNIPSLLKLVLRPSKETDDSTSLDYLSLAYNLSLSLISKRLEPLVSSLSRRLRQQLNTENLEDPKELKEMRDFKIVEKRTKVEYNPTFPLILVYLLRLLKLKEEGEDFKEPNIDPLLSTLKQIREELIELGLEEKDSSTYLEVTTFLEDRIIYLFYLLLKEPLGQLRLEENPIFKSPIITYLILISVDPLTLSFKEEAIISKSTSKLIYSSRLFFLGYISLKAITKPLKSFEELFTLNFSRFLTNQSKNYFEELTQIRAYLLKIIYNTTKPSRIIDIEENLIAIDEKTIDIEKLRVFFSSIIDRLEEILYKDLLFTSKDELDLPLDTLKDNISSTSLGFYFTDFKSKEIDYNNFKELYIRKLLNKDTLFSKVLVKSIDYTTSTITFNKESLRVFLRNRNTFLTLLLLAIYLTSGSPIRGEEIVLLKYRNSSTTRLRNIVIDPGTKLIRIETNYSKTYNLTRLDTNNIRYLSYKLSSILKTYLLVFLPFYNYLSLEYLGIEEPSSYLFTDKETRYTSSRLSSILKEESLKYLGEGLTLNPYRHLIIYIIKKRLLINYKDSGSEKENLIEDILANHTTRTTNLTYSRELNLGSTRDISIEKRSLEYNLKFFKFFRLPNTSSIEDKKRKETLPSTSLTSTTISKGKHRRQVSSIDTSNKKTRTNAPSITSSISSLEEVEREEETSYPIEDLEISSSLNNLNLTLKERSLNRRLLEPKTLTSSSIYKGLRELFKDPNASFRSKEQELAIEAILLIKNPYITYISSTSSGKSLLFFLPSFLYPNRKFIVVSPRVSLLEDLLRRSKELGLRGSIYNPSTYPTTNLLFINIEYLEDSRFNSYLLSLREKKESFTLFLEEAHLLVLEESFRYTLKYISSILKYIEQLVFLSATLPNPLLDLLEAKFYLRTNRVIRGSTTRTNISYILRELKPKEQEIDILKKLLVDEVYSILKEGEKFLIYTNSTKKCISLEEKLGLPSYYSLKGSIEKEEILKDFTYNTTTQGLIGTSAIEVGLDISSIRAIIILEPLFSLVSLEQAIGRGGRDNKPTKAYILTRPKGLKDYKTLPSSLPSPLDLETFKILDYNRVLDFLTSKSCLRTTLEAYFNNKTLEECLNPLEKCYRCLENTSILEYSKEKELEATILRANTFSLLKEKLEELKDTCIYCLLNPIKDIDESLGHNLSTCPRKPLIFKSVLSIRSFIKYNKLLKEGSACFSCLLPSKLCLNRDILNETCTYPTTILEGCFLVKQILTKNYYPFKSVPLRSDVYTKNSWSQLITTPIIFNKTDSIKAIEIFLELDLEKIKKVKTYSLNKGYISNPKYSLHEILRLEAYNKELKGKSRAIKPALEESNIEDKRVEEEEEDLILERVKRASLAYSTNPLLGESSRSISPLINRPILEGSPLKELSSTYLFTNTIGESSLPPLVEREDQDEIELEEGNNSTSSTNYSSLDEDITKDLSSYLDLEEERRKQAKILEDLLNKLLYYKTICLMCSIEAGSIETRHSTIECLLDSTSLALEKARDLSKKANIFYSKGTILTRLDLEEPKNKYSTLDPDCLLPSSLCFKARKANRNLKRCTLKEDVSLLYYLIYTRRLSNQIPSYLYLEPYKIKEEYINYLSNKEDYKGIRASKGTILLAGLNLGKEDSSLI